MRPWVDHFQRLLTLDWDEKRNPHEKGFIHLWLEDTGEVNFDGATYQFALFESLCLDKHLLEKRPSPQTPAVHYRIKHDAINTALRLRKGT